VKEIFMDTRAIVRFSGNNRFLSNFYPAEVILDSLTYSTVEHAYQAAKTLNTTQRRSIRNAATPGEAKKLGRKVDMRQDWDNIKTKVMRTLLEQKFKPHSQLAKKLQATGQVELIEGNTWGDVYWGQCPLGVGSNMLGLLLMEIRKNLNQLALTRR
jgi:ribA/ribD-fused uncharacterized protein